MPAVLLTDVPTDALALVLSKLTLVHEIAAVAPTCRALKLAVLIALKTRPFSRKPIKLRGSLWHVAVVPDGRIVTGACDKDIKVWRDGTCLRTIETGARRQGVAVLGGAHILTSDPRVKLWALDGTLERTFATTGIGLRCVVALPDGVHFAVGYSSDTVSVADKVRLYHVDGTLVHTFVASSCAGIAVTCDGQHIISASWRDGIKVWSVASKSLVSAVDDDDETGDVRAVAAMPDGQRFLSSGRDETVRVWLLNGTLENTFRLHSQAVSALVALPDNKHVLSGAWDKTVKLFNVNDGAVLRTFPHHTSEVRRLTLLPDGIRFVSGSSDKTARITELI